MTKQAYFDMCEQLGTEPLDSEIPVEVDDFPIEVQEAFIIYRVLRDEWDTMNGHYLGKNLTGISDMFDLYDVPKEQRLFVLDIVAILDSIRREEVAQQISAKQKAAQTKT